MQFPPTFWVYLRLNLGIVRYNIILNSDNMEI